MKPQEKHVYGIISGDFDTTEQYLGVSPETLGWRSCLGLHLWYKFGGGPQTASPVAQLHTVMESYDAAWQTQRAPRPRPPYAGRDCPADQVHDVCYALLQSFGRFPVALEPRAYTPSVLNCSFVWHLQSLLADMPATHASDATAMAALPPQRLHSDFIFQLETLGLLRWAIYVATQWRPATAAASTGPARTPLAFELLCRFAPQLSEEEFLWLRDEVGIPLGWLAYARALTAGSSGDAVEEAVRLAEALAEMGSDTSSAHWPFRRPLLLFALEVQSALAPDLALLVDAEAPAPEGDPVPFAQPLCRWARHRLRAVVLGRLAPCVIASLRRRRLGEHDTESLGRCDFKERS